ncbi:Lysophospholipase [Colletotrichum truncatum]|uniref:Lysophospholipase n=1 Tax=Colletotrichum truncatum TaxID=5467 RepID=A0ACC3YZ88_COLTU|nr:Lysophospholipase [Colletotrichum truncatum]KAF6786318.1 Lysophospholipase [Colletotrichum truncatum]
MRILLAISSIPSIAISAAAVVASGPAAPHNGQLGDLNLRALPDSPSGNYAPEVVDCPTNRPTIRSANSLSKSETEWLPKRREKTISHMKDFLKRSNISDFDAVAYIETIGRNLTALPNIGLAISGGGYRAFMNGAGFLAAVDSRVDGSTSPGGLGGLLQSSTYLSGLSGGSWLIGSLYANNFSTVTNLRDGSPNSAIWALDRSILEGPKESGISILNTASYWSDVAEQVRRKREKGFNTSITDYWGRTLSYQLINATDGGPGYTFSSIAVTKEFTDAEQPLPIIVADERSPGTKVVSLNSTVFEFNPWEMGSFDPTLFGFAPTRYIGSNFTGGIIPSDETCIRGFDQFGYIMGTSSSLFNQFMLRNISDKVHIPSFLKEAITDIMKELGDNNDDIAQYSPNPFLGFNTLDNRNAGQKELGLVDGGEDGQNIPLHPLIQPTRAVDVIFAVDSSSNGKYTWPNGTSLRATYKRSLSGIANGTRFPVIPDAETFINLGLNRRPTAFGCDVNNQSAFSNSTSKSSPVPPLIVYIPNTPYTAWSNVSTFDMEFPLGQRNNVIQNGFNVATMGNGTVDAGWRTCVGCFVLQRSFAKTGTTVPAACQRCFNQFCWNGTVDSRPVSADEPSPLLQLASTTSVAARSSTAFGSWQSVLAIASVTVITLLFPFGNV